MNLNLGSGKRRVLNFTPADLSPGQELLVSGEQESMIKKEHLHSFKGNSNISKFAQHLLDNGHSFGRINDVTEVLNFSKKKKKKSAYVEYY
jgi:hypothetical protein